MHIFSPQTCLAVGREDEGAEFAQRLDPLVKFPLFFTA